MGDVFSHTVDRDGDIVVVALTGELDMSGFDALVKILNEAAEQPGIARVHVDLGRVGFIDSKGMQALLVGCHAAERVDVRFAVIRPQAHVRKVLGIAGLLDLLSGEQPCPPAT
jgi:anti-anti-sigma factor